VNDQLLNPLKKVTKTQSWSDRPAPAGPCEVFEDASSVQKESSSPPSSQRGSLMSDGGFTRASLSNDVFGSIAVVCSTPSSRMGHQGCAFDFDFVFCGRHSCRGSGFSPLEIHCHGCHADQERRNWRHERTGQG
jgi:hypothetical protein